MFFLNKLNPKQSLFGIIVCIALLAVLPFVAKELGGTTWVRIIDMALLYIMLALGLNIVVGFAGCWIWATSPFMPWALMLPPCWLPVTLLITSPFSSSTSLMGCIFPIG